MNKIYVATAFHCSKPFSTRDIAEKELAALIKKGINHLLTAEMKQSECFFNAVAREEFGSAIRIWNDFVLCQSEDGVLDYETYFASIVEKEIDEPFFPKSKNEG